MEDVLTVYELPYDKDYPQVCLDEKLVTLHADVVELNGAMELAPGLGGHTVRQHLVLLTVHVGPVARLAVEAS